MMSFASAITCPSTTARIGFFPSLLGHASHSRAQAREAAALHYRTGQRMRNDFLGELRAVDQGFEIDAGFDAHFVAHEYQILRADVARGAAVSRERTAAQPGDRTVEALHSHLQA